MKILKITSQALFLLVPFLTAQAQGSMDQVKIDTGAVQGSSEQGIAVFKGIPFAAPPVGDLRWRAPQPAAHWTGVREATQYGSDCMQLPFPSDAAPLGTPPSEDCLYMNVWTPAHSADEKLPVMVWIYGGGFVNGGSSPAVYAGTRFAQGGVVFVSFNYRVGRFGFFGFPALTQEEAGKPLGNYAYMDQIAALQWVQRNIAAFGGNPRDVTVFGESAGGGSVMMLLTSPITGGLFEKAIVESGGGRDALLGVRYLNKTSPAGLVSEEQLGISFAKANGIDGTGEAALAALRALPAEKVVNGLNMASMGKQADTYGGPIEDGTIVTMTPEQALLSGRYWKVPFMIGSNNADIGFPRWHTLPELWAAFGPNAQKAQAAFDPTNTGNPMMVGWKVAAEMMMTEPARFVASTLASDGVPSYEYRFSYVAESIRAKAPGAFHATEIPFVFDTVSDKYGAALTPADAAIAKKMNEYWINFAKHGNPNGDGLPHWPAYSESKDELINFTTDGPVAEPDPWKKQLDLVETLDTQTSNHSGKTSPGGK
ncbi:MAG TPA: carboxylesterase family protein [Acidobacteriaceae bacterium]|jgi:para-nitrobenzyl esterase|nr:carboxylesterase family protein [Acidobacteriaceae bacterium]